MNQKVILLVFIQLLCLFQGYGIAKEHQVGIDTKNFNNTKFPVIYYSKDGHFQEQLAAKELRRYIYLRTSNLCEIKQVSAFPATDNAIIIASKMSKLLNNIPVDSENLSEEEFLINTLNHQDNKTIVICGGDPLGTLYGAYRFCEHLGIRFYLHGDVIPDQQITNFQLPDIDETRKPLFAIRGILPFHDFPVGPDWWQADDYKAYLGQMTKMRMNMIALHCYPEWVGPEPMVWIGLPEDVEENGDVTFSHQSSWIATKSNDQPSGGFAWGYASTKTSDFAAGAGRLFAEDAYGHSYQKGHYPRPNPEDIEACVKVMNRAGDFLSDVFKFAEQQGVKTCIGTESPLRIPRMVKNRLQEKGLDPEDSWVVQKLYEGMFTRIKRKYPVDYYWLWTPEKWTWEGNTLEDEKHISDDMQLALNALDTLGNPFIFATCGWVLGPQRDRTLFDAKLPKDAAITCINRNGGRVPVDPGFAHINRKGRWAIPWIENDWAMISPQFNIGRLRRDAADAHKYDCNGLLGIHWRTKILSPGFSVLSQSAWSQTGWNPEFGKKVVPPKNAVKEGALAGETAKTAKNITDSPLNTVYQSCRFGMQGYRLELPNGSYDITLRFSEHSFTQPGLRSFGVEIQEKEVVKNLDLFNKVGLNKPFEHTVNQVKVEDSRLHIGFKMETGAPLICGIEIKGITDKTNQFESRPYFRAINCGGPSIGNYEADLQDVSVEFVVPEVPRDLPCDDFYLDWAQAHFGKPVAQDAADLFVNLDKNEMPTASRWVKGPGGFVPIDKAWEIERKTYDFVDKFAALREKVTGKGNLSRFDYWLNTFRHTRMQLQIQCTRGELDQLIEQLKTEADTTKQKKLLEAAVACRIKLARQWEDMMTLLLSTTDTPAELGSIATLEQSSRNKLNFINVHDELLKQKLGQDIPKEMQVSSEFRGDPRIIILSRRTHINVNETFNLKIIVLDQKKPETVELHWRVIGEKEYHTIPANHIGRAVYNVCHQDLPVDTIECFITARTASNKKLIWPPTAPKINQTVVVCEISAN